MNKTELIAAVAEDVGVGKKDTEQVLNAFFSTVQETLKQNDKVQIPGFGSFEVRERAARTGRNPHYRRDDRDRRGKGACVQT